MDLKEILDAGNAQDKQSMTQPDNYSAGLTVLPESMVPSSLVIAIVPSKSPKQYSVLLGLFPVLPECF